ncbi:MAG: hypothetical protein ACYC54_13705 [Sedimentisphaerales bacterium]
MKLIKMNMIVSLLLFSLVLAVSTQASQVVFFDDFEAYTAGAVLPAYPNSTVPVGLYWHDYLTPSNDTVSTMVAKSGVKSLHMVRDLSASSHLMALSKTTGALADGQDLLVKQDVYLPSASNTCENYYNGPSKGGWYFDGATIRVLNAGGWVNTGVAPDFGAWNTYYAVLHMVQKSSSPITWGGTYDMYLVKADGSVHTLGKGMALVDIATGDIIARLHLYAGYASELYYDNITMTGNYVAECGDMIHPIPVGDLNDDCKVDFTDFAKLAANWMTCTPVACP